MVVIKENRNLETLGPGGKPKIIKEKEPDKKSRGKVLKSRTGDLDENFYLR